MISTADAIGDCSVPELIARHQNRALLSLQLEAHSGNAHQIILVDTYHHFRLSGENAGGFCAGITRWRPAGRARPGAGDRAQRIPQGIRARAHHRQPAHRCVREEVTARRKTALQRCMGMVTDPTAPSAESKAITRNLRIPCGTGTASLSPMSPCVAAANCPGVRLTRIGCANGFSDSS